MLAEQCRRLGIDVEASSAHMAALSSDSGSRGGVAGKMPGWNLDLSIIHRRIKEDQRNKQRNNAAAGAAAEPPPYSGDASLPPGWEVCHSVSSLLGVDAHRCNEGYIPFLSNTVYFSLL